MHLNYPEIFYDSSHTLCVDLDGTLIQEDVTELAFWGVFRTLQWHHLLVGLVLFIRSYARAKAYIENAYAVDVSRLTYNLRVMDYIRNFRARGGRVVLATAADEGVANRVAQHTQLFDEVVASNGDENRRAACKAACLNAKYGAGQYIYAGNSRDDLAVWAHAAAALVVNAPKPIAKKAQELGKPTHFIDCSA